MRRMIKLILIFLANLLAMQVFAQTIALRSSITIQANQAVTARGNVAYVAGTNNLVCVNITNPSSLAIYGQASPNVGTLSTIDVSGDYVFCASASVGIVVCRVADPTAPTWVRNFALAFPVKDIDAQDTLLAVATGGNISLVGARAVSNPHILATYGRAGATIEFDWSRQKIMVGSNTGAFSLNVNVNINGSDTTFSLSLDDEYGSGQIASPCTYNFPYFDVIRSTHVYSLHSADFTLAGTYDSPGVIEAVASAPDAIFIALATSAVQYLNHTSDTPSFLDSEGIPSVPNGIAVIPDRHLVCVAQNVGLSVLEYGNLATDDPETPAIPEKLNLSAYPNPFNSMVELKIETPQAGNYELKVFDMLGREIKSDKFFMNGSRSVTLDFRGFSSGEYLAQVKSEQSMATTKLIYLP